METQTGDFIIEYFSAGDKYCEERTREISQKISDSIENWIRYGTLT